MMKHVRRLPLVVLSTTAVCLALFGWVTVAAGDAGVVPRPPATSNSPGATPEAVTNTSAATTVAPQTEPASVAAPPAPSAASEQLGFDVTDASEPVEPLRVRIPGIEVDAPITDLGLNDDGTLEVPSDFDDTGWYTGRSVPGELGPSVVVGHVDSTRGPAVFFRLRDLVVGDRIQIDRSDGLVAWFEVTDTVLVDKDEFPTEQVYAATDEPTLRLITCGGSFDRTERSYRGNVIVYAEHVGNYEAIALDGAT